MRRRIVLLGAVVLAALVVSACAAVNVNKLPQPGENYGDGYDVIAAFANVLNLPERAKVVLDGTTVGVVTGVQGTAEQVDVTLRVERGVTVPSNIRGVLEQATVLGDIYVSLERDGAADPAVPNLGPGGRIPLAQTTSPPQLEDTIATLSNFVASGSIQRIQDTIIGLNRVTPPRDEVRKLASQFTVNVAGLSDNLDLVDIGLTGVAGMAQVLRNRDDVYEHWFSRDGMLSFDRGFNNASYLGTVLPKTGSIYSNGYWLVPLLRSLADTVGALQQSKWAFEDEVPAWRRLFSDSFLPQDKYPAINITSIVGPDGRELSGNVQDVLRILGAMP